MKLKTINSSKLYEWHNHFLWLPKKVRITPSKDIVDKYILWEHWQLFEYSLLWLETVERKHIWNVSFDTDDWEYIYWKKLWN